MNDWLIAIVGVLAAAILAVVVPRAWLRWQKRTRGALVTSLSLTGFVPYSSPQVFLVPDGASRPQDAPGNPDSRERDEWLERVGIPLGWQTIRLTLRARTPSPVVILEVKPVVLDSGPPLKGWFIAPELGGGTRVRRLVVDLDAAKPQALLVEPSDDGNTMLREAFTFQVSDTDVEVFEIEAFTTTKYVSWGADIHYEDEGKAGILEVRDDRLRLTAESRENQRAVYQEVDGSWSLEATWGYGFSSDPAWRETPRVR